MMLSRMIFMVLLVCMSPALAQRTIPLSDSLKLTLSDGWHYAVPGLISGGRVDPRMTTEQFENQIFLEGKLYELAQDEVDRVYRKSGTYTPEMQVAAIKTSLLLLEQGYTIGPNGFYNPQPEKREIDELAESRSALQEQLRAAREKFSDQVNPLSPSRPQTRVLGVSQFRPVMISGPEEAGFKPSIRFYQKSGPTTVAEARREMIQSARKLYGENFQVMNAIKKAHAESEITIIGGEEYYKIEYQFSQPPYRDTPIFQCIFYRKNGSILKGIELTYQSEAQLDAMMAMLFRIKSIPE